MQQKAFSFWGASPPRPPDGATENARHENAAQGKMQGWKMQEWKMRHKTAGLENAGLENTAQEILGWKMREKSVWKANRRFSIKWIIVYWHNKNKHVVGLHIFRTTVLSIKNV